MQKAANWSAVRLMPINVLSFGFLARSAGFEVPHAQPGESVSSQGSARCAIWAGMWPSLPLPPDATGAELRYIRAMRDERARDAVKHGFYAIEGTDRGEPATLYNRNLAGVFFDIDQVAALTSILGCEIPRIIASEALKTFFAVDYPCNSLTEARIQAFVLPQEVGAHLFEDPHMSLGQISWTWRRDVPQAERVDFARWLGACLPWPITYEVGAEFSGSPLSKARGLSMAQLFALYGSYLRDERVVDRALAAKIVQTLSFLPCS